MDELPEGVNANEKIKGLEIYEKELMISDEETH
jgi:hypothetical protein